MAGMNQRHGGCLCGAVRYSVRGEPFVADLCHCTTCRKLTGSAFSMTANWRLSEFSLTGEVRTFARRSFCPACGSRLFFFGADDVEIFLGTLDDAPSGITPMAELWTIRREHWQEPVATAIQHERNPA